MNRNKLIELANDTINISEDKCYSFESKLIQFSTKHFYKLYKEHPFIDAVKKNTKPSWFRVFHRS